MTTDQTKLLHIDLASRAMDAVKKTPAIEAARFIAEQGGSPREQLDAARQASGKKLNYTSHQGMRQRLRNLARMAEKEKPND